MPADYEFINELFCPRCGALDVDIVRLPDPEGWFTRIGKAHCRFCGMTFPIRAIDENETEENPNGR